MSHLDKCHNCLESLTTQMLSVHLKLKTCTLKCKVCWTDLTPPNPKDAWMADVTNSDFVRIHQESLDCKEKSVNNFFSQKFECAKISYRLDMCVHVPIASGQ